AKLRRPRRRGGVEDGTLAADRKGPRNEPYVGLFRVKARPLRDCCPCRLDIAVRYRIFLLRPDARPSGFACFRRLSPRVAGRVPAATSLWAAANQYFALFQVTV